MRKSSPMTLVCGRCCVSGECDRSQEYRSSHSSRSSGDVRGSASSVRHMRTCRRAISLESQQYSVLRRMHSTQCARSKTVSALSRSQAMLSQSVMCVSSVGRGAYTPESIRRALSSVSMMHIRPMRISVHFSKRSRSETMHSHGLRCGSDMRCAHHHRSKRQKKEMKLHFLVSSASR